jgi:hypothetical protein
LSINTTLSLKIIFYIILNKEIKMDLFDKIYALAGDGLSLFGIGTVIYGMFNNDMETILGGFALTYAGSSIKDYYSKIAKTEVLITAIITQTKELNNIANKLEKMAEKKEKDNPSQV